AIGQWRDISCWWTCRENRGTPTPSGLAAAGLRSALGSRIGRRGIRTRIGLRCGIGVPIRRGAAVGGFGLLGVLTAAPEGQSIGQPSGAGAGPGDRGGYLFLLVELLVEIGLLGAQ